jgi:uncharacterized membrane protein YdjX (TVP38/TMEM64 family)
MEQEKKEHRKKSSIHLVVIGLVIAGLIAASFYFPVKTYILQVLEWTEGLGIWAPVVVIMIYILSCVLFLPGSVVTLGAGFLFGVVKGTIIVSIGSTLGAAAAFIVGRTLLRKRVEQKVSGNEKFAAIDEAVGDQGLKIVFLTRLSPVIPFNLLNYAFGVTRVPFGKYVLASWIGMLPATVMYVYFGSALGSFAELASGSIKAGASQQIFFWIGLFATIVVVAVITRIATKAFKSAVGESPVS